MRASGILLPVFSLPDEYGIGSFSSQAREFIDFLTACGQKYWQILPISPVGEGYSPYQSYSTYAIEPLFIDLKALMEKGLISDDECSICRDESSPYVDYERLLVKKYELLKKAFERFTPDASYEEFLIKEGYWLNDYATFMSMHEADMSESFEKFLQYQAFSQWMEIKSYANSRGIQIVGDIPIYVSPDGADLWANKELFQLSKDGEILNIAGCPADKFAPKGQLWNNPLYDWEKHAATGYEWWIRRMKKSFEIFDVVRIDHFRGFDEYFSIPKGDENAFRGKWLPGPGIELFRAMEKELGDMPVIAEDLGFLTESVRRLLKESGYPGMKVLQFGFGGRKDSEYLPPNYPENSVAYTGTHDNQSLLAWIQQASGKEKRNIKKFLKTGFFEKLSAKETAKRLIMELLASRSKMCIIPLSDYLFLGDESRINTPSTLGGTNWRWRLNKALLDDTLKDFILSVTRSANRV